jgi:DNA segregation ATPase FtsK/SpoIIIE and related proteins
MTLFETHEERKIQTFSLDERLHPEEVIFVIFLFNETLDKITLTTTHPYYNTEQYKFGIVNDELLINGSKTGVGKQDIKGQSFFIVSEENAATSYFIRNETKDFVFGKSENSGIQVTDEALLILHNQTVTVKPQGEAVYLNDRLITQTRIVPIEEGLSVLTPSFYLEKRQDQWKITSFSDAITFNRDQLLKVSRTENYPKDFPDYRRSPRLNLEVPEESFKLDSPTKDNAKDKNGLMKLLMPPLGMLAMTGITTVLSGRNPAMMLGMGGMSLMTAEISVSQYVTEKKEKKIETAAQADDYKVYLINEVSRLGTTYEAEKKVLHYQQPTPLELSELVERYDARIYERQRHNKDFLEVSLGLSDQPSNLKVEIGADAKDLSEDAVHLRNLQKRYTIQRNVATPIQLANTTLGFVGTQEVLKDTVQALLFQTAFFHSYQDVNFISLLSKEAYQATWHAWRMLPHFKLSELNMRGLIYNEKSRDVVLNAFYQLLMKRKQTVKEAGKEKPQFSPHYIFTIQDDTYLAGHGLNELLAEDMSALGVTVIWCKEKSVLLPETVSTLIEVPNEQKGRLVNVDSVYVDKVFKPYILPENLEQSLRTLSNLHHLEVEKNAVPESLSLLEQYEVKRVEELEIPKRWQAAQPNKSIKSLIGWRGKSDYAYWDLHERAHGPHALVGGTTGSGKSEFLTTYLIGLAINFSPEDIGMLIIDWKGGGIANTLDKLPHFMGAITNLDGAGTARALASIKAELDKRQREFAKFGVNNINGYMSLYKERLSPKEEIKYPTKPLPHLVLVSDEFAELKSNVPEFLDELTSVARIGRSLGVHLILATQKPSGVVNDQIEANSKSKIALKMAGVQDSNELLKTPDAAHITNPGRGYLKVGENEVYELFQSGYAGVPYDPESSQEEVVDERIYKINALGQHELLYDPGEEVKQGKDTSDLPTQLEEVISEIGKTFDQSQYALPDKPWLPNLGDNLPTPNVEPTGKRTLKVPLGLLDIPSNQTQENYDFNLAKQGNTVIFASSGYGKSTILQTLALNLAKANTPEQVQLNLLDFGNNGLLPLKDLPHVADIVTLEEEEKLQKMLDGIAETLAIRKKQFKDAGVASLEQYEAKNKETLPIIVTLLDNYDGLSPNDKRKDGIDNLLLQVLRDGASLGVYLIFTASQTGAVRMNMTSAIATKMALYLNEESEITTIMGREKVLQEAKVGRGQVMVDVPRAIQFYLPVEGTNSTEILEHLEKEVSTLNENWNGMRPAKIPMVPEELTEEIFESFISVKEENTLYLGLNKATSNIESIELFNGNAIGFFLGNKKQTGFVTHFLEKQFSKFEDMVIFDMVGNLSTYPSSIYVGKDMITQDSVSVVDSIRSLRKYRADEKFVVILNGLAQILNKIVLNPEEFYSIVEESNHNIQFVLLDVLTNVGGNYGAVTTAAKENLPYIFFGGDMQKQNFVEMTQEARKKKIQVYELMCLNDEVISTVVLPRQENENE